MPNIKGKSITHLGLDSCFQDRPDNKRIFFFSSPVRQTPAGVVRKTSRWWEGACLLLPLLTCPGFHQEAQLETWLLCKESPFPL